MEKKDKKHSHVWIFIIICILATIWVEYTMIHAQSYADWSNKIVAIQTYVIITCLTMLVYVLLFRRRFRDVVAMTMMYVVLIVFPIGTIIAIRDGYALLSQLLDLSWLFVHDFFYIVMVCQAVLTWILLVAMTEPIQAKVQQDDELSEDDGGRNYDVEG